MAYVNYMEVGKTVLAAIVGGASGGALHFMLLQPYFAGQMLGPVKVSAAVDWIIAFIAGLATTMYTTSWDLTRILGFGVAGFIGALGVLDQFNLLTVGTTPTAAMSTQVRTSSMIPRASYLAAPGVIVNKHGSVPEVAAGTFG